MKMYPRLQAPQQVLYDNEKTMKFYLNQIDKLNKQNLGPFVTKSKNTIIIKLVNYNGRSVAM